MADTHDQPRAIATPKEVAAAAKAHEMDVDHHGEGASGARAAAAQAAAQSGDSGRATFIPAASYTMPAPTWRVKPQFASWEIDHTRFEIKRLLGKGSYGSVAEAIDHLTGQRVAIKRIPGVFEVRRGRR